MTPWRIATSGGASRPVASLQPSDGRLVIVLIHWVKRRSDGWRQPSLLMVEWQLRLAHPLIQSAIIIMKPAASADIRSGSARTLPD